MASRIFKLESKVFVYPGMSAWRFLSIPKKESSDIKENFSPCAKAWGSLPVSVTIGNTTWDTSIFPDKKSGTYLLPLKAKIRKAEQIYDDSSVSYSMNVR